jgi:hypothetical protein
MTATWVEAPLAVVMANEPIAAKLEQVAALLEEQEANLFRVHAWRAGADTVRALERPVLDILRDEGIEGIDRLPGIGPVLTRAIREVAERGRLGMLDRLRGEAELRGPAPMRGPSPPRRYLPADRPPVSELLDVDREYRERAAAGTLPLIAPRRFNPAHERWLPVLHCMRGDRHYTALFSNTALAHRIGRTHDWAVIYYDGRDAEHRATVVTATKGPLVGRRVVRGRERECIAHYKVSTAA